MYGMVEAILALICAVPYCLIMNLWIFINKIIKRLIKRLGG